MQKTEYENKHNETPETKNIVNAQKKINIDTNNNKEYFIN
jgi:hypothetical protein